MAGYTQTGRAMILTTPLGKDVLLLVSLTGREAISELFSFQLDLLAVNEAPVAFDKLLGDCVESLVQGVVIGEDHDIFAWPPSGGRYETVETKPSQSAADLLRPHIVTLAIAVHIDTQSAEIGANQAKCLRCRDGKSRDLKLSWPRNRC